MARMHGIHLSTGHAAVHMHSKLPAEHRFLGMTMLAPTNENQLVQATGGQDQQVHAVSMAWAQEQALENMLSHALHGLLQSQAWWHCVQHTATSGVAFLDVCMPIHLPMVATSYTTVTSSSAAASLVLAVHQPACALCRQQGLSCCNELHQQSMPCRAAHRDAVCCQHCSWAWSMLLALAGCDFINAFFVLITILTGTIICCHISLPALAWCTFSMPNASLLLPMVGMQAPAPLVPCPGNSCACC